jgi:formylglycine-generating enzyme required for sulfatase activity
MTLVAEGHERFCIDRWEASLVEVTPNGERPFSPYESPDGLVVRAVSREGVVPQGYVSRNQADRACKASSKRLCTEDEWATACRGAPPRAFPYGEAREKGACNDSGVSPLKVHYAGSRHMYMPGPMNDPRLNQTPGTLAKTGGFARCTNAFGVFDMVGNLHEWVMSPRPTFRGGYYLDTHINGDGCAYRTTAHGASYHDYSTGFRCCVDARSARAL